MRPQNNIAVGAHFGPARQGPGRDLGKVAKLVERMEVHEGVSEQRRAMVRAARTFVSPKGAKARWFTRNFLGEEEGESRTSDC
jgi:hypothetical protein